MGGWGGTGDHVGKRRGQGEITVTRGQRRPVRVWSTRPCASWHPLVAWTWPWQGRAGLLRVQGVHEHDQEGEGERLDTLGKDGNGWRQVVHVGWPSGMAWSSHGHSMGVKWERRGWQRQVGVQGTVDEQVMIKVRSEQWLAIVFVPYWFGAHKMLVKMAARTKYLNFGKMLDVCVCNIPWHH